MRKTEKMSKKFFHSQMAIGQHCGCAIGLALVNLSIGGILPVQTLASPSATSREVVSKVGGELTDFQRSEIAQFVPPRGIGAPPDTVGAGSRSAPCPGDPNTGKFLTPLIPSLNSTDNWGVTVEANPQIFVYIPQTVARSAEFVIQNQDGDDVYRTTMNISGEAGIISLNIPKEAASLKVDENYSWYFTVFCNPRNRKSSISVAGGIRRIALASSLDTQLKQATDRDRPKIYAQNGIWYEAISSLAALIRQKPNDSAIVDEWKNLLQSAGLEKIQDSPINLTASQSTI